MTARRKRRPAPKRRKKPSRVKKYRRNKKRRRTPLFKWKAATKRRLWTGLKIAFLLGLGFLIYQLTTWQPANKSKAPQTKPAVSKPAVKPSVKHAVRKPEAPVVRPKKIRKVWNSLPKMVFVIDDIGYKKTNEKLYRRLGRQVNYAVLPFLNYSAHFGNLSRQTGADVILHLPLEAKDGTIPGPGLLTTQMPPSYVVERLNRTLGTVPNHVGVNSHMGSYGTTQESLMSPVLKELKRKNLFFLDSQTTPKSIAYKLGKRLGVETLKRDVFLDNVDEPSVIRDQVRLLERIARKKGYAIGIGHDRKNTLTVILEEIPRLERSGVEIISLTDLLDYQEQKRS